MVTSLVSLTESGLMKPLEGFSQLFSNTKKLKRKHCSL